MDCYLKRILSTVHYLVLFAPAVFPVPGFFTVVFFTVVFFTVVFFGAAFFAEAFFPAVVAFLNVLLLSVDSVIS